MVLNIFCIVTTSKNRSRQQKPLEILSSESAAEESSPTRRNEARQLSHACSTGPVVVSLRHDIRVVKVLEPTSNFPLQPLSFHERGFDDLQLLVRGPASNTNNNSSTSVSSILEDFLLKKLG